MDLTPYQITSPPFYHQTAGEEAVFAAAAASRLPLMLKGPTGCGKTRFVEHMAWRLRRPLITVACHEDMTAADLSGRYLLTAKGTVWQDGPLTTAVRHGVICYLDEVVEGMNRTREFLKIEYPRYYWNPNFESYVPKKYDLLEPGSHFPRAVAKTIYANAYYAGERPMDVALRNFVNHVEKAALPSLVTVCFSLAGGTGTSMVMDMARHLSNVKFGRRIPVIGVG